MKIRLLQNVVEHDKDGNEVGLKVTRKRNKNWTPPKVVDEQLVESTEPQFTYIPFTIGTVMEVSEATGQKYIEAGKAEEVKEEKNEQAESSK